MSTEVEARPEASQVAGEGGTADAKGPDRRSAVAPDRQVVEATVGTVPEMFQRTVERRALRPAMLFKAGGRWNTIGWEQYAQGVRRIAGYLLSEGFAHGERGAILSYNRPEWHIADLAIQHLGGCVVGIYLTNSASQVQYIVDHAEAPVVFVENRDQLAKLLLVRKELPKLKRVVLISGDTRPEDGDLVVTWGRALEVGDAYNMKNAEVFEKRWRAVRPEDMATFIYTSGTTGPPKAVMLDHRNICWTVESLISCTTLTDPDEDVMISYLPLAHIAERMAGHVLNLYNGHRLYFAEDLAHLAANVQEAHPTFMFGVPRIWEKYQAVVMSNLPGGIGGVLSRWALAQGDRAVDALVEERDPGPMYRLADRLVLHKIREKLGLDRARGLSTGAAPISPQTLRWFWSIGLKLYEVYGQSEGTGPTSTNREGYTDLGTVGPAIPGVEIRLADDGEVLVRGGNVFRGYFKDEATTRETLDADGWLHSGDVGELDGRGYLRITDRKKDLIITAGGKNISPSNIEVALKRQPYVGSAVAIGDSRPFMSALLTIDPEQVQALAAAVGAEPDPVSLSENVRVHEIFQKGVDAVNQDLANVERIKKFTILPADLSVEGGELTPTLKVKRKVVGEKYRQRIEAIYG